MSELSNLAELFFKSMATVKADSTIRWYRKELEPLIAYLSDKKPDEITLYDLESYRATLNRDTNAPGKSGKLSAYTIHGFTRAAKRFFSWLYHRQLIKSNPAEFLEKPRLPKQERKGINPNKADKMLEAAADNPRDLAILLFIRDTGCRAGGIYNLKTDDLDIENNKALITEKGNKQRMVFFTTETAFQLGRYEMVRHNPHHSDYFFLTDTTFTPITYTGLYEIFRRLAKKSGVKSNYSPHQWRHAAIRSWLKAGLNLKSASEIAGHSSERVTGDIYGTLSIDELHELYNNTQIVMAKLRHRGFYP